MRGSWKDKCFSVEGAACAKTRGTKKPLPVTLDLGRRWGECCKSKMKIGVFSLGGEEKHFIMLVIALM